MYAVVEAGGRQVRVEEGKEFLIDFKDGKAGSKIVLDKVLGQVDGNFPGVHRGVVEEEQPRSHDVAVCRRGPKRRLQPSRRGCQSPP